jgi:hypothetical protein
MLRVVVFLGPLVALLATGPAGNWPSGGLVALTLVLAGGFAMMPESPLGTVAFCVVVVWWGFGLERVAVEAVPAAAALLAAHLAALLLSYGPAQLPLDGPLLRLWMRRGLLVGSSVPAVWVLAVAVDGQPEPPGIWIAALAGAVVICGVAAGAVTERIPR